MNQDNKSIFRIKPLVWIKNSSGILEDTSIFMFAISSSKRSGLTRYYVYYKLEGIQSFETIELAKTYCQRRYEEYLLSLFESDKETQTKIVRHNKLPWTVDNMLDTFQGKTFSTKFHIFVPDDDDDFFAGEKVGNISMCRSTFLSEDSIYKADKEPSDWSSISKKQLSIQEFDALRNSDRLCYTCYKKFIDDRESYV